MKLDKDQKKIHQKAKKKNLIECILKFNAISGLGSLPHSREGTPLSSVEPRAENSDDGSGISKRRLSFSLKEPPAPTPTASPETLPGEIFSLENIQEEPGPAAVILPRSFYKRTKMKSESEMESIDESFDPSSTSSGGPPQMETSLFSNTSNQVSETSIKVSFERVIIFYVPFGLHH